MVGPRMVVEVRRELALVVEMVVVMVVAAVVQYMYVHCHIRYVL